MPDKALEERLERSEKALAERLAAEKQLAERLEVSEKALTELRQELTARLAAPPPPLIPYKAMAERLEKAEKEAEELRQKLFDHISVPPPPKISPLKDKELAEKLEKSEKALAALRYDLTEKAFLMPLPPVVAPATPDKELVLQLERSEKAMKTLRHELSFQREEFRQCLAGMFTREDMKKLEFGIDDLAQAVEKVKGNIQEQAAELAAVHAKVADKLKDFEDLSRKSAAYAAEFAEIEHTCRLALGDMQGCVKEMAKSAAAGNMDAHVRASVEKMHDKFSALEKALYAGLGDLSGRLMADEVLYRKIFGEAEERVRKGLAPEMDAVAGKYKTLEGKVSWLTDEYDVVMKRKVRALEGKYSALEALAARLDAAGDAFDNAAKRQEPKR